MTDHSKQLAKAAERLERAHADRDAAIIAAHEAGLKPTAIARAVGLSRMQVHRIIAGRADSTDQPT